MKYKIGEGKTLEEKLTILTDAAKYDVACTSSGVDRNNDGTGMGNAIKAGICHSFSSDGRCISLLKILFTNGHRSSGADSPFPVGGYDAGQNPGTGTFAFRAERREPPPD